MRRTWKYAAVTKDECNAADGCLSTASGRGVDEGGTVNAFDPNVVVFACRH